MVTKQKILIVDDDNNIAELISLYLTKECFETRIVNDGEQALKDFASFQPDLILLDLMLPGIDGYQVCREIRHTSDVPIIMLTARGEEEDELHGFSLGVDEYIAKPFSLKILLARIEAVFRRGTAAPAEAPAQAAGLDINTAGREVRVDGCPVELTYTEFELLNYLVANTGVALSRDKILDNVWRYDYYGDARTVDTHVKKLRSKLGARGEYIKTIRGIGYKFEP